LATQILDLQQPVQTSLQNGWDWQYCEPCEQWKAKGSANIQLQ
jgi:hypothetical protein